MLYIRTDMNPSIATGHMMRCLSIADAAASLGEDVTFILADSEELGLIQGRGYQAVVLHTKWDDMDSELDALYQVIQEKRIKALLIDSYMVTKSYLQALAKWTKTAYIDDRNTFVYPVHILICYANYWQKFKYSQNYKETKLLLGTQYVPLRKDFHGLKRTEVKSRLENILLMSGGSDKFHILPQFLKRLNCSKYKAVDVICGTYCTDYEQLSREYGQNRNIHIHKSVNDIKDYMLRADAAISAGGTTLYELCACGTPTITYSFADNQLDNVHQFAQDGLMDYLGDIRCEDVSEKAALVLEQYEQQYELREQRIRGMQELVDGGGAARIAKELIGMNCNSKHN